MCNVKSRCFDYDVFPTCAKNPSFAPRHHKQSHVKELQVLWQQGLHDSPNHAPYPRCLIIRHATRMLFSLMSSPNLALKPLRACGHKVEPSISLITLQILRGSLSKVFHSAPSNTAVFPSTINFLALVGFKSRHYTIFNNWSGISCRRTNKWMPRDWLRVSCMCLLPNFFMIHDCWFANLRSLFIK